MTVTTEEDNGPYADYQALEQRYRGIIRHLVVTLLSGVLVGTVGTVVHMARLDAIERIYDPYAYFVLAVIVGRTAAGFGWALLAGSLAALAPLIPALIGMGLTDHDIRALGGDPASLNILIVVLVGFGLVSYVARTTGPLGDIAAGTVCGVLLADVAGRVLSRSRGAVTALDPAPAAIVVLLVLGLLALLRRGARAAALLIVAAYLLSLTLPGALAG
jgi:hypothetical protein